MNYILSVLLALDQFINAVLGGYPTETISYRAAFAAQRGKRWGCVVCRVLEWVIPNHCDLQNTSKADRLSRGGVYDSEHLGLL